MSHFLIDRRHLWHGHLMKLILIVGLLNTLAVSEIKAQPLNSMIIVFAMPATTETSMTTPAQGQRVCKETHTRPDYTECRRCAFSEDPCHPGGVLAQIQHCSFTTCRAMCMKKYTTDICCHGFWGDNCSQECPGGSQNPCNGHGKCSNKHGACVCEPGFEGTACELCTSVTKYGPDCSLDCKCLDGECNNGIHGDGLCAGDNPCQSSVSPCRNNSQCTHTDAGRHRCACHDGFAGDGTECAPINPCRNNNGGCDNTTDCIYTGPNQHKCQCKNGYEGDNPVKGCTIKDICFPGLCGPNAVCQTWGPLKHSCVCKKGYTWDRQWCNGNIIKKLKELNIQDTRFKGKLKFMGIITKRFFRKVLKRPGPFTIFVPTDRAFRNVINDPQLGHLLGDGKKMQQIIRQHIAAGRFMKTSSSSFYNLQGNLVNLETTTSLTSGNKTYFVLNYDNSTNKDTSHVLEGNLEASNGIIHIINDVIGLKDVMSGGTQETAMDFIKNQADYSTMYSMIMVAGLSKLFSRQKTTVLIADNKAWDSPSLDKYYLKNDKGGRRKLRAILKHHIFPGVFDFTDMMSTRNMKSYANYDVRVHLSDQGQIRLNDDVSITKVSIPVMTGLCHRVDKVMVPSQLLPLVKNVCQVEQETEKYERRTTCCKGFYGHSCLPCPGGSSNPCSRNGKCSDGDIGTGVCSCNENFVGTACNQCANNKTFGPHCNEPCTCQFGQCDAGPEGTGKCRSETCKFPYTGENCDQELTPCESDDHCPVNAKCFLREDGIESCHCSPGYEDDGNSCSMIDLCAEERNPCHQQATCSQEGPGFTTCTCNNGWHGDGFSCMPNQL